MQVQPARLPPRMSLHSRSCALQHSHRRFPGSGQRPAHFIRQIELAVTVRVRARKLEEGPRWRMHHMELVGRHPRARAFKVQLQAKRRNGRIGRADDLGRSAITTQAVVTLLTG